MNFVAPSNGKNFLIYFAADGSVLQKLVGGTRIISKTWFFNDDSMLCRTFGRKNRKHCTSVKTTGSPQRMTFFNDKLSYRAKLLNGKQLSN